METLKNIINKEIRLYEKKVQDLSVYVADMEEQERFFRNNADAMLYYTIKTELRLAKIRKQAFESSLLSMKKFLI